MYAYRILNVLNLIRTLFFQFHFCWFYASVIFNIMNLCVSTNIVCKVDLMYDAFGSIKCACTYIEWIWSAKKVLFIFECSIHSNRIRISMEMRTRWKAINQKQSIWVVFVDSLSDIMRGQFGVQCTHNRQVCRVNKLDGQLKLMENVKNHIRR